MADSKLAFKKTRKHAPKAFPLLTAHGWKAIAVFAGLLGFLSVKFYTVQADLDESLRQTIQAELEERYHSELTEDMGDPSASQSSDTDIAGNGPSLPGDHIEIVSISARGNGTVVARVEVSFGSGSSSDRHEVRYFRARRTAQDGWRVIGDADWWRYYLTV